MEPSDLEPFAARPDSPAEVGLLAGKPPGVAEAGLLVGKPPGVAVGLLVGKPPEVAEAASAGLPSLPFALIAAGRLRARAALKPSWAAGSVPVPAGTAAVRVLSPIALVVMDFI